MFKRILVILIPVFILTVSGCGKKAPPRPPNVTMPNPPTELSAKTEKDGVVLTLRLPLKNDNGTDFADYKGIEIYRAKVVDETEFCKNCTDAYKKIFKGKAIENEGTVSFKDDDIDAPAVYYYRARVFNSDKKGRGNDMGTSAFSAPIKVTITQ